MSTTGSDPDLVAGPAVDRHVVSLGFDLRAARAARRHLTGCAAGWDVPAALVDALMLVLTELVTNAVRHGRAPVQVALTRTVTHVCLDVEDAGESDRLQHALDEPHEQSADLEGGRGLTIAAALSDSLTCVPLPGAGKRVRAAFACSFDTQSS